MAPVHVDPKKVREFKTKEAFYDWLSKHWDTEDEVWIKMHKVSSGQPSITPKEAIDVELCWGWVDGIRKGFDEQSFLQRYTPRRKNSVWSQINRDNVERLTKEGLMQPSGQAEVDLAKADGRWDKAYSVSKTEVPDDLLAAVEAEPAALEMYGKLSSQNRFALTFRTMNMKTEAGRKKKIQSFVEMLKRGETPYPNGPADRKK
ncbi:MAG: YdeI/OmpD-associated family protein [Devosia sp.]